MKNPLFLKDLAQKLMQVLPDNIEYIKNDMEKNIHAILQDVFTKLDLVTREEFDIQVKVLARTRKKLELLIKRLDALEKQKQ